MDSLPPLSIEPLPNIDLRHMLVLTDDTSIIQHATSATPNLHHGYCTDDTARALIAGLYFYDLQPKSRGGTTDNLDPLMVALQRYLAFLSYAYNPDNGRFRNFMHYDRSWLEEIGSEDSHARALWGLGIAVRRGHIIDIRNLADDLFRKALRTVPEFDNLRPCAYALLGIDEYLRGKGEIETEPATEFRELMGVRLWESYQRYATEDWPWWEDCLTWGNAKLPHALLVAGMRAQSDEMMNAALASLQWLMDVQKGDEGQLSVIGNEGWWYKNGPKAQYDQQPIEAKALLQACLFAALCTRDPHWIEEAELCFEWFTGRNDANGTMYNTETGGGFDGIGPQGINTNQGAESTLAYILSVEELHLYDRAQRASADMAP